MEKIIALTMQIVHVHTPFTEVDASFILDDRFCKVTATYLPEFDSSGKRTERNILQVKVVDMNEG
jgi:hypothetical protein